MLEFFVKLSHFVDSLFVRDYFKKPLTELSFLLRVCEFVFYTLFVDYLTIQQY